jgi:type IV pilus assembly protein PilO
MALDLKNIDLKNIDLKDTKTQTVILMILLGAIAAVLYIFYIFLPQVTGDINIIGKTIVMRRDMREARSLMAEKDTLKKKAQDYNEKIEVYEKKLPAQQEIPRLLEDLSKMARNANITIIGITPVILKGQKEKKVQVYQEIPILITAKSSYHEFGHFLSNLENGDRFIKVVDISIKANATAPKKHDVELMVYTYVLPSE